MTANPLLFNCQPRCMAPDWSRFTMLVVSGMRDTSDRPDETEMTDGQSIDNAEFFTVFGIDETGDGDPITDCETPRDALAVAATLGQLSALPVRIDITLAPLVTA